MKGPDLDRERSEGKHTASEFLKMYNDGLPEGFPHASLALLNEYKKLYAGQFANAGGAWSLDQHRKKVMDWLPMHLKSLES